MTTFRDLLKRLLISTAIGQLVMMPYRLWYALSYYWKPLSRIPGWVIRSREFTNFTYDVTARSAEYTAAVTSIVTGCEWAVSHKHLMELDEVVAELRLFSPGSTSATNGRRNDQVRAGRRLIHYSLVRALKPKLVVEAGTSRGLGTCIMAAALLKNRAEGSIASYPLARAMT